MHHNQKPQPVKKIKVVMKIINNRNELMKEILEDDVQNTMDRVKK